jgi:hypothetical protein
MKYCLYCSKPIPSGIHGNSGSCSHVCKRLRKKSREQENYNRKKNIADPVLELQNRLKALAEKFGYETAIDLSIAGSYQIDWALCTGTFQREGNTVTAVGSVGYIFFKPNYLKIYKL